MTLLNNPEAPKSHLLVQLCVYQNRCLATVIQLPLELLCDGKNLRIQNFFQLFLISLTLKKETYHSSINQLVPWRHLHMLSLVVLILFTMWSVWTSLKGKKHKENNKKKIIYRTHSASLNHSLVVVEYAVQLSEAGVNISHTIFSQNVTLTQATTVLLINKALIAA